MTSTATMLTDTTPALRQWAHETPFAAAGSFTARTRRGWIPVTSTGVKEERVRSPVSFSLCSNNKLKRALAPEPKQQGHAR
jgi:hypothetical protein